MQLIFTKFGHFTLSKWHITLCYLVILFLQTYNTNMTNVHELLKDNIYISPRRDLHETIHSSG